MNYFTSNTNGQQPSFSGGLNGSAGDSSTVDAFERLFNLNNTNGSSHPHSQGQDHSPFTTTTNNNNTLDASLFAGFNNGNNDSASVLGRGFNGANHGEQQQQQANLFSQLLMAKANGYTNNNDAFGTSQLGGSQGINNNNNNDGLFLTQQSFLNAASNAGAMGGMTQSLTGLPQAMSNTTAPASNNNNADNFMINAQQAQQLLLMDQLGQQQQQQNQQQTIASIPHQQLLALLAGMNGYQVGGSNFNGNNNAFAQGNMAAPTTMQQLLLQQQQQLQSGNILLPSQSSAPLEYNHQLGNSFHEFLGNVAPASTAPSIKPVPPAPPAPAPLRALSAYNFYFRYQRERILNGEDMDNEYDDSDTHWNKERQDALLEEHWGRDRTVKRRHRKSHGKISFADLSKKISQSWKALPEQRKDFFREVAGKDWARYHRELTQHKLDLTTSAEQSAAATINPLMGMP